LGRRCPWCDEVNWREDLSVQEEQAYLFEESSPAGVWQRDAAKRALDGLFSLASQYKSSREYFELIRFVSRFRFYSPFNAVLIHAQMERARYVAPPHRWLCEYKRHIKIGVRPYSDPSAAGAGDVRLRRVGHRAGRGGPAA
jgi:hypothetical protein